MSIWGRHDSESPAGEAPEGQAETGQSQAEKQDTQEPAAEHQDGEPAPAFWRAQGEAPASPAAGEAPAGTGAPVPVLTGVVIDGETAVKDPGLTGTPAEQTGTHDATAAPAMTEVREPIVAVAHEPAAPEAQEPAAPEAQEPAATEAREPAASEARAPAPAAATVTPQRWSEILVAFVDDPRGSVKMAADAVDEAIDEFVNSVRARQHDLAATWQVAETDTEQLRGALREYRKLGQRVQQLDLGERTGA